MFTLQSILLQRQPSIHIYQAITNSPKDKEYSILVQETALGFVFFTWFTVFPILGLLVGVAGRGFLSPAGDKGWFAFSKVEGVVGIEEALPLQIALFIWAGAHLATIWHFDQGSIADRLRLGGLGGVDQRLRRILHGSSHRYHRNHCLRNGCRALVYSCNDNLFTLGALFARSMSAKAGFWTNETFSESWAPLIWLAITFFVGVAITMIGNHEKYIGWSNREEHRPVVRQFWNAHWASLLTAVAFLVGLVIRIQWRAPVPSMHAMGTDGFDMTGGSDPWYRRSC